jgi:hypothetical protein
MFLRIYKFVQGSSNTAFIRRNGRPLSYAPYESQIASFVTQFFPFHCSQNATGANLWHQNKLACNHLIEGVKLFDLKSNELLIISDVDEFVKRSALLKLIHAPPY